MMKKEILVVGDVSYKIMSSLNNISKTYTARKSNIGEDEKSVDILEGYPPDIIIIFINNADTGWYVRIKKVFDRFNYKKIPIICVGTNGECNLIKKMFMGYIVHEFILPLSIIKLNELIITIIDKNSKEKNSKDRNSKHRNSKEKNSEDRNEERLNMHENNTDLKHILVVDDDVKMLRLISGYLTDLYKVSVVNSGAAAIAFLGKKKPDLILLDYLMPICDGVQVLQMIRDLEDMKDIPVVFLTSVSDSASVTQCLKLNPQGYLLKPVAKDKLINKLDEIFFDKQ